MKSDFAWTIALSFALFSSCGCGGDSNGNGNGDSEQKLIFRDIAKESGVVFEHFNGMSGERYMVEMVGAGSALLDFDGDGDLDLYCVQGSMLGSGKTLADARPGPPKDSKLCDRLYRNDLVVHPDGRRECKFVDITAEVGLEKESGYGQGVIAGDFDNDGRTDLFVTNFGPDQLLRNIGGGRFEDVTAKAGAGLSDPRWNTSAVWFDYDRDGWLDLFVCAYIQMSFANHHACKTSSGADDYCGPHAYPPESHRLYRNKRDGTFEDVSVKTRVGLKSGSGLGVVASDLNNDGRPDLIVANDGMANFLWLSQPDGTFQDMALERGCALSGDGRAEANMGVVVADFDNDEDDDLLITHLRNEKITLYRNLGECWFQDDSARSGVEKASRALTGFGVGALDYDNDGWLDLACVNGEVRIIESQAAQGIEPPMRQKKLLLRNLGSGRFQEIDGGPAFQTEQVGRGAAFGDIDNDGDLDLVATNNHGPAEVLINQVGQDRHWLGLRLIGGPETGGRDMHGAIAILQRPNQPTQRRRCGTDGSYCSSSDPRMVFGLGDDLKTGVVTVIWPDGLRETWEGLTADTYHTLVRGQSSKR